MEQFGYICIGMKAQSHSFSEYRGDCVDTEKQAWALRQAPVVTASFSRDY